MNTATPLTATLTFTFSSGGTILAPGVLTRGAKNLDFTDGGTGTCTTNGTSHVYSGGNSCTVVVKFKPKAAGTRYGAAVLYDASNAAIATAYLFGTGTGPQVVFGPAPQTTVGGGFLDPQGLAGDGNGNLYIGDAGNRALKEIPSGCQSASCVITLMSGFSSGPGGVAIDGAGNLYVTGGFTGSDTAVMIPPGCTSSACATVLGAGVTAYAIAVGRNGNVYVTDKPNGVGEVQKIPVGCTSSSCVVTLVSGLGAPFGVAVDGNGNVYAADDNRTKIIEIPVGCSSGSCVVELGGGFTNPLAVAVDGVGNIYVSQISETLGSSTLSEMPAGCTSASCVTLVAAGFEDPGSVTVGGSGNVFIANNDGSTVVELNRVNPPALVFAPTAGGETSADSPQTVAIQNIGNEPLTFPIPSSGNNPAISASFSLNSSGEGACPLVTSGSESAGTLAVGAICQLPISFTPETGIDGSVSGSLVLKDNALNAAAPGYATQTIPLYGSIPQVIASGGEVGAVAVDSGKSATLALTFTIPANGTIGAPAVLTQGVKNLDFTDAGTGTCTTNGTSHVYSAGATCTVVVKFVPKFPGTRYGAVVLDNAANTAFATTYINGVGTAPEIAFNTAPETALNGGFSSPYGVALDGGGNLYVTDPASHAVKEMAAGCTSSSCVTTLPGDFVSPIGLAVDGAGNVYVADFAATTVAEILRGCASSSCVIQLGGGFSKPIGVAVDMSGNVFVVDYADGESAYEIPPGCLASSCTTQVGGGIPYPVGVAVDRKGDVYVSGEGLWKVPLGCTSASCSTKINSDDAYGVTVDGNSNVYYSAHPSNGLASLLEMVNGCASSSCTTTLLTKLVNTGSVVADGSGNIYLTQSGYVDGGNSRTTVTVLERATPPTLTFPATEDGQTSSAQNVVVENIGNELLSFPIPSSGSNPSISANFSLNGTRLGDCPVVTSSSTSAGTLSNGAMCTLQVSFTPGSGVTGSISGSLVLTDNTMNAAAPGYAKQTITLSGTATAP